MAAQPRVDIVGTARGGVGVYSINFDPTGGALDLLDGIPPGSIIVKTARIESDCTSTPEASVYIVGVYACGETPKVEMLALEKDLTALEARVAALETP
jgi:hypothetical protein